MLELQRALSHAKELVARLRAFERSQGMLNLGPAGEWEHQIRHADDPSSKEPTS